MWEKEKMLVTSIFSFSQNVLKKASFPDASKFDIVWEWVKYKLSFSDEDVSFLCTNSHKKGKSVYLSNLNYPHPISAGKQQCQCLIKTGNFVGIDIHALDIIITRSDAGNQCFQDIEIQDEDGHRKEITCGHPGLHAFRKIYNSDVRSVTLTLNNNAPKAQGYIWLQAKGNFLLLLLPFTIILLYFINVCDKQYVIRTLGSRALVHVLTSGRSRHNGLSNPLAAFQNKGSRNVVLKFEKNTHCSDDCYRQAKERVKHWLLDDDVP